MRQKIIGLLILAALAGCGKKPSGLALPSLIGDNMLLQQKTNINKCGKALHGKTVDVTAGNLKTVLNSDELNTVTNLTLTCTINAHDFKTMRDDMPNLTGTMPIPCFLSVLALLYLSVSFFRVSYLDALMSLSNRDGRFVSMMGCPSSNN